MNKKQLIVALVMGIVLLNGCAQGNVRNVTKLFMPKVRWRSKISEIGEHIKIAERALKDQRLELNKKTLSAPFGVTQDVNLGWSREEFAEIEMYRKDLEEIRDNIEMLIKILEDKYIELE